MGRRETCAGALNYPTRRKSSSLGCRAQCGTGSKGPEWKGRFRKRVGAYRIIFRKFPDRGFVEISAILVKSKDTYR